MSNETVLVISDLQIPYHHIDSFHFLKELKRQYEALITQTASPIQFGNSLKFMSKVLELHYTKKVIILIDEYDTPITYSYLNKYYKKMVAFMKKLFSSGLKAICKNILFSTQPVIRTGEFCMDFFNSRMD